MGDAKTVLIIGYGNVGRLDDGLGPALIERLEERDLPGVTLDADYQLQPEDAASAAQHDVVIFADAAVKGTEPFFFLPVEPAGEITFSSHATSPGSILYLAERGFGKSPDAYALGIRGYDFNEFGERLSEKARANLDAALDFVIALIGSGDFDGAIRGSME